MGRMAEQASKEEAGKSDLEDIAAGLEELKIHVDASELFGPPPPKEDCPICFLPMPVDVSDSTYMACCGKRICCGCDLENERVINETNARNARRNRDQGRAPLQYSCAFCREPAPTTKEEVLTQLQKRMDLDDLDDAEAVYQMAERYRKGEHGVPKDERTAFKLFVRAAELGCAGACIAVASCYRLGKGVEKDEEKQKMYLQMGAKTGDAVARHNLGLLEYINGNVNLTVRNWLISAAAGHQASVDNIKTLYKEGKVSKDDFATAIRSCHAARKAEWSKERDRWAAVKAKG